jgi:hypothetical protein
MQVLVLLAAHAGQVVAKERLIQTVWPDAFVTDGASQRMTPGWKSSSLSGLAPTVHYCLLATITLLTASPCAVFPVCVAVSVFPSAETTTLVVTVGLPSTFVVTSKVWSSTRL